MKNITKFFLLSMMALQSAYAEQFDVNAAAAAIISAPDWTVMDEKSLVSEGPKIIRLLSNYSNLSIGDARELTRKLAASGDEFNLSIGGKIYILNRIYCNVPKTVDRSGWKFFGGWVGVPINESSVGALFPLVINDDGSIELKNVFGGYTGPRYSGLEELDFLIERFGRRIDKNKK